MLWFRFLLYSIEMYSSPEMLESGCRSFNFGIGRETINLPSYFDIFLLVQERLAKDSAKKKRTWPSWRWRRKTNDCTTKLCIPRRKRDQRYSIKINSLLVSLKVERERLYFPDPVFGQGCRIIRTPPKSTSIAICWSFKSVVFRFRYENLRLSERLTTRHSHRRNRRQNEISTSNMNLIPN